MKINSIHTAYRPYESSIKSREEEQGLSSGANAGLCKEGNIANSGRQEKSAAVSFKGLYGTKIFGNLMDSFNANGIAANALIAIAFASILRPATIMSLPGKKDKEDKLYASAHSFSSGLMGFAVSYLATTPLGNALRKIIKNPGYDKIIATDEITGEEKEVRKIIEKHNNGKVTVKDEITGKETIIEEQEFKKLGQNEKLVEGRNYKILKNKEAIIERAKKARDVLKKGPMNEITERHIERYNRVIKKNKLHMGTIETIIKNAPEWILAVPRAMITIALLPFILKYVFGVQKKPSAKPAPAPVPVLPQQKISLANFAGGLKK
jgi:hypothetical protein